MSQLILNASRVSRQLWGVIIAISLGFPCHVQAEQPRCADCEATQLLPKSVVALAEVSDLSGVIDVITTHPLRARLEALPAFESLKTSGAFAPVQLAITALEGNMQMPWQQAIGLLTDRGITVALDASDGGVAVLMRSSDPEALERFRVFVLAVRQMQVGGAAGKQGDYRGFTAYAVGEKLKIARLDDWLLLTNNSELGKAVIDRYLDGGDDSLQSDSWLSRAKLNHKSPRPKSSFVTGYLDVEKLRTAGVPKGLFNERVDNFLGELVLGGVLANLRRTPYATGDLNVVSDGLRLQFATPHDRQWEPPREYYFGEPELAAAPALLEIENRLFAVSAHRDLSQMWLRSGDLLSDRASDELAKADTQLTTFFSGRDFGEDILGSLESDIQIVGQSQDFEHVLPKPAIKLPAFALQFRMKTPEETQPELRRVFQSFIGFLNVTGAMNGQPQLDLGMESVGAAQLITATYVADRDQRESVSAPINFNFSPTLAFAGDRIILASSSTIARTLVQGDLAIESKIVNQGHNTVVTLDASTLQSILESNKAQLVANNMLEKGHGKEAAEGEIGLLLKVAGFVDDLQINFDVTETELKLNVDLNVNTGQSE